MNIFYPVDAAYLLIPSRRQVREGNWPPRGTQLAQRGRPLIHLNIEMGDWRIGVALGMASNQTGIVPNDFIYELVPKPIRNGICNSRHQYTLTYHPASISEEAMEEAAFDSVSQ